MRHCGRFIEGCESMTRETMEHVEFAKTSLIEFILKAPCTDDVALVRWC